MMTLVCLMRKTIWQFWEWGGDTSSHLP